VKELLKFPHPYESGLVLCGFVHCGWVLAPPYCWLKILPPPPENKEKGTLLAGILHWFMLGPTKVLKPVEADVDGAVMVPMTGVFAEALGPTTGVEIQVLGI
jgi:hypothetical protein